MQIAKKNIFFIFLLAVVFVISNCGGGGGGGISTPATTNYSTSDLAGTWGNNGIASGTGAPWWMRGQLTIASNGSLSGTLDEYNSNPDIASGTFSLASDGGITMTGSTGLKGYLDYGKSIIVWTNQWSSGATPTTEMFVTVKLASSYTTADLQGTWGNSGLATGTGAPWWMRGKSTITANGSVSGTLEEYNSNPDVASGTLNIASDGTITMTGSSTLKGYMDSGKSLIVWTSEWSSGDIPTTELFVSVKLADSYTDTDLAGTWGTSGLASGTGAPWYERGKVTANLDGTFSGSMEEYGQTNADDLNGTLSLASDGTVTIAGNSNFKGYMDSGKSIIVWTNTWTTGQVPTTELFILQKLLQ